MYNENECDCMRCIYKEACPCGYHIGNAACIAFYRPQTKEMLLQCLETAPNLAQAWEQLNEYLRGYYLFQSDDKALQVSQLVPLSAEQLQVLAMRKRTKAGSLRAVIQLLQLSQTQDLTVAEYAVLLALLP